MRMDAVDVNCGTAWQEMLAEELVPERETGGSPRLETPRAVVGTESGAEGVIEGRAERLGFAG